ncbi:MAG TPA: phosphoadenosine phosphosulfate reductase family protein [Thermoguttaceae bacterium]|nr:phosphoadenosine phosphosulfate reductase family protein [Thermoguttaceae bacterium]
MNDYEASALNLLRIVRQNATAIGVAVSFGKDSLATLDLCCRVFRRVEGYYLFRVRGLSIVDEWAAEVRRRHGVKVRMYPHFDLSRCYRNAVMQPHYRGLVNCPKVSMTDIELRFRDDAKVDWIAYGWRRNDSFSRALILKHNRGLDPKAKRVFPLRCWRRQNVLDYLSSRGIPLPPGLGRKDQGGLDFAPGALEWLKKERPADYAKWLKDFPFSEIQSRPELQRAPTPRG